MAREAKNAAAESLLTTWISFYKVSCCPFRLREYYHELPVSVSSIAWQLFDLAVAGDLTGFDSALTALSDASPAELAILHPKSVR